MTVLQSYMVVENYQACALCSSLLTDYTALFTSAMARTGKPGYATKVPELSAAFRDKPGFLPVYRGPNPQGVSPSKPKRIRKPRVKAKAAACKAKTKSRRGANAKPPRARRLLNPTPDAACAQPAAPTVTATLVFSSQNGGIFPEIAQRPTTGIAPDATSAALGAPGILASRCAHVFQPPTDDSTIALGYATMEVERCPIPGLSDDTTVYVDKHRGPIFPVAPPSFDTPIISPLADHESYPRGSTDNSSGSLADQSLLPQPRASPPPSEVETHAVEQKRASHCDVNGPVYRASRPRSDGRAAMEGVERHGTVNKRPDLSPHDAGHGRKGGLAGPDTVALAYRDTFGKSTTQDVYLAAYVNGGAVGYQDAHVGTSAKMNAALGRLHGSFAGDDDYLPRALRQLTLAQSGFELAVRGGHAVEQAVPQPIISVQEPAVLAMPRARSDPGAVAVDARVQPSPRSGHFLPSNSFSTERSVGQAGHGSGGVRAPIPRSPTHAPWNDDANTHPRAKSAPSNGDVTISTYSALSGALSSSGREI
ncbi:hypothetical protein BD413DRAFT_598994 [Trametes elegans]|nr:hypothetical protein BD413DRAFT_598994 [Trametes elegans]